MKKWSSRFRIPHPAVTPLTPLHRDKLLTAALAAGQYAFPQSYVMGGFTSSLPPSWGGPNSFPSLQTLNLFGLNIIGSLPEQWSCSTCFQNLRILQITGNPNLTGTLPANWSSGGSFPSLQLLNLANASLHGSIPQSWAQPEAFPDLLYLSLANTTLTGSLPSFHNKQLQLLDASFSTFGGNISELWNSTSPLAAISINAVPITGAFPPTRPPFFSSLQILIADNTSMNSTIPTSWLEVANAETALSALDLQNFMHNVSFSGLQFWVQSWEDPAWWADLCSSASKLAGYGLTNLATGSQLYFGIANLADIPLDVTLLEDGDGQYVVAPTPQLPSSQPSSWNNLSSQTHYYSYYFRIKNGNSDFGLTAPYSPNKPSNHVASAAGQCPNQHRNTYVIAAWVTFGALLVSLLLGLILWIIVICKHPRFLSSFAVSESTLKRILFCWQVVPLLGLGLYLYDLISDVEVVQAVWGLESWYGKSILSILICHYILRGLLVTVHLSSYHGKGRIRSALQFGLTLLCIPVIVPAVLVMDILSCFEFLHIPFGPINPQGYREMRGLFMPIFQSLPNVILTTVIFYQGSSPTSLGFFRSIDALQYSKNPQFLSHDLYLQAAITSFGSILWGIGELYHITHKNQASLTRSFWDVVSGSCLRHGKVKVHLHCQDQQQVQLNLQIV